VAVVGAARSVQVALPILLVMMVLEATAIVPTRLALPHQHQANGAAVPEEAPRVLEAMLFGEALVAAIEPLQPHWLAA